MSRRYANVAADLLRLDPVVKAWATGGILTRDPRRSGANATGDAFETDADGEILPTVACVGVSGSPMWGGGKNGVSDGVEVRLFAPDFHTLYDGVDKIADRIQRLLHNYRQGNENPGLFDFEFRLGMQTGGQWQGIAYDHVRFLVHSVYAPVEVTDDGSNDQPAAGE